MLTRITPLLLAAGFAAPGSVALAQEAPGAAPTPAPVAPSAPPRRVQVSPRPGTTAAQPVTPPGGFGAVGGFGGGGYGGRGGGGPAFGGLGGGFGGAPMPYVAGGILSKLQDEYRRAQADTATIAASLQERSEQLARMQRLFRPEDEHVRRASEEVTGLRARLNQAQAVEAQQGDRLRERLAPMLGSTTVQFRDATVRQAAQTLSQAARIPIEVDKSVPEDKRLTVEARQVPMGRVLEAIAEQSELQLVPTERGILLTTWPSLKVGPGTQAFTGVLAPWSDEWGMRPTDMAASFHYAVRPGGRFTTVEAGPGDPSGIPGLPNGTESPFGGPPAAPDGGAGRGPGRGILALTSVVNPGGQSLVVVAEPGAGPQGQPGMWLTVYEVSGTDLVRRSSVFHRPGPAGVPGPGGPPFGAGGFNPYPVPTAVEPSPAALAPPALPPSPTVRAPRPLRAVEKPRPASK
jgi:hypothetical protein